MDKLRQKCGKSAAWFLLLLAPGIVGCGESYRSGEVDGILLIGGKPGHKVHMQFVPDIDKGTQGPISMASTDSNGRFTLELKVQGGAVSRPGAVVGWHRVVLSDSQLAESATGRGVPIRLAPEYTSLATTPLGQEVKEGKQSIEIKIP